MKEDARRTKTELIKELKSLRKKMRAYEGQAVQNPVSSRSQGANPGHFQTAFESAPIGMAIVGLDERFLLVNQALCHMLGYTEDELLSTTVPALSHPEDMEAEAVLKKGMADGSLPSFQLDKRYIHRDGHIVWGRLSVSLIRDETGTPRYYVGQLEDITEQNRAELALKESESKYRLVLDHIDEIIYMVSAEYDDRTRGKVQLVSGRVTRILGIDPPEFQKNPALWFQLIHPDDIPVIQASTESVYRTARSGTREYRIKNRSTGQYRWIEDRVVPQIDEKGLVIGIFGVARDITNRKQMQEQLHLSDKILQKVGTLILVADDKGEIRYASQSSKELLGYDPQELLGDGWWAISRTEPEDRAREKRRIVNVLNGTAPLPKLPYERMVRNKNGEARWMLWQDSKGPEGLLIGVGQDITERKLAEESLRESEEKFRSVADQSPNMIFINQMGRVVYANKKCEEVMGYTREEIYGENFNFLQLIDPQSVDLVRSNYERHILGEEIPPYEYKLVTKDGRRLDGLHTTKLIQYGGTRAILGIIVDVTERNRAELELTKLRKAVEASGEVIFMTDREGILTYVNPEFCQVYGYTADEVVGKTTPRILKSGKIPRGDYKEFWETILGGQVLKTEIINKTKTGNLLTIETSVNPVHDESGTITGFLAIQRDITDRRAAREALVQSENRFRALIEKSSDVIAVVDPAGKNTYKSPSVTRVLGYAPEELVGKDAFGFIHPDERNGARQGFKELAKHPGQSMNAQFRYRHKDGSWRWMEATLTSLTDEPSIGGIVVNYRDVTEQKSDQEKIEQQAALLDVTQDAIFVCDMNDTIVYWNKGAERIYGWDEREAIGKTSRQLLYSHPEQAPQSPEESVLTAGSWMGELTQVRKDGSQVLVESRWSLIRDQDNAPRSKLFVNTDITLKKTLEKQFLRTQRMESVGTLAGGIAHDLNNVLSPIIMSLHILRTKVQNPADKKILDTLEVSAQRGADLVKQVLTFSRGSETEKALLQIRHLINDIKMFANETFPPNITIVSDIPRELWTVQGDATQIHQILLNLCVNGRDAMLNGGTLQIHAENLTIDENYVKMDPESKAGQYVVISVRDSGVGMSAAVRERIFEPFFTTKESGKGTGLGLSTVFALVKNHSGFIQVQSEEGRGSIFRVFLPASPTEKVIEEGRAGAEYPRGSGQTILVVDDETSVCEITKLTLEENGYKVLTARDGAEALTQFFSHEHTVGLVLTDLNMPIMDGLALIRALRRHNPSVRIIAATGVADRSKAADLQQTDILDFLPKPFTAERLLRSVGEAFNNSRARATDA